MELIWQKKNYNFDKRLNEQFEDMEADFDYRKTVCKDIFNKMKNIYVPIANEFIVYDQPHAICGTIDMLAYNKKKDCYSIIDWKTSKRFDTGNTRFPKYMKEPFGHILYCNTAEYSLQLSLYKYILEKHTSLKIGEMVLFQIPNKDNPMPQVFRCLDFSSYIANFLDKKIVKF